MAGAKRQLKRHRLPAQLTILPALASLAPLIPTFSAICFAHRRAELIGSGAFGRVYLGLNLDSGQLMAVKHLDMAEVSGKELSALSNEVQTLKGLQHEVRLDEERSDSIISPTHIANKLPLVASPLVSPTIPTFFAIRFALTEHCAISRL